jgi:hypothetical protein
VIGKLNNEHSMPASILNYTLNTIISLKISLKGIILLVIHSRPGDVEKSEKIKSLERPWRKLDDKIKMDLQKNKTDERTVLI